MTWKTCQKAEGKVTSGLMWAGGQVTTKTLLSLPSSAGQGKYNERLLSEIIIREEQGEIPHQFLSQTKQTGIEEISLIYCQ